MQLTIFAIVLFRFTKQDSLQQIAFILHTVKYLNHTKRPTEVLEIYNEYLVKW